MSPLELVERAEDMDGVHLTLPAPTTLSRAAGRLALVILFGLVGALLGFTVGGVLMALTEMAVWLGAGFAGVILGLLAADRVSAAVLPILAPARLTLGQHHIEIRHRQQRRRLMLSEIAGIDEAHGQIITRSGRRVAVAPQQPEAVRDWAARQVSAWLATRLREQGSPDDVPVGLRALSEPPLR